MSDDDTEGERTRTLPAAWEQSTSTAGYEPDGAADGGQEHRFWSPRRVPAAVTAAATVAVAGLFLYDIVRVRAERSGIAWRHRLADELATRTLDDAWVLLGAAVALLLGLWLLVLALTPGLRALLPMRRVAPDVRAGLDRGAAAVILRDRAMQISGVQAVRVAVGRRRVNARADAHFRDLDDVRADLDAVLGAGIDELGLGRRPALHVQVRRPAAKK